MQQLQPAQFVNWATQHPLAGSRLRRCRIAYRRDGLSLEIRIQCANRMLYLRLTNVAEFRLQHRTNQPLGRIRTARLGFFQNLVFLDLDAVPLPKNEKPAVHDFRASNCYAAGEELWWREESLPAVGNPA